MAKALECPACGAKHRVERLPDAPTFRCASCGQKLRIPEAAQAAAPGRSGPTAVVPPPRRRADGTPAMPATGEMVTATATATVPAPTAAADTAAGRVEGVGESPAPPRTATRIARVHWWWRVLAWVVAVPIAGLVTGLSAYDIGWIKKDDLLDVFIGSGTGRYNHLAVVTLVWALLTAVLVQVFVEGGRWIAQRRRKRRAPRAAAPETIATPPRRKRSPVDVSR